MTANISSLQNHQSLNGHTPVEGESQELVHVLQKIVQNAGALLEVERCSLALLDTTGTSLVTLAALNHQGRKPRHTRFHLNEGVAGWVAEHREPLVIADVSRDPRFKRLGHTPVGSMVCVPLIHNGDFIGALTASSQATSAFDTSKLHMLTIFAEQAVLAITNARHAELARRQADQLEMLLDLSRGITTRHEPEMLYRTILADVQRLVPCELAVMYQYSEQTQELLPVAELACQATPATCDQEECLVAVVTTNLQQEKISLHNTASVAAWAAVHRHPILHAPSRAAQEHGIGGIVGNITANAANRGSVPVSIPATPTPASSAEMATPFVSKSVLYGVITLRRAQPFTSEELRLVRNLSNMAAAALENVELFHRVRTDQEQLRAILASSSDGIAIVGANTCFIEANPAFGRIFGLEPDQIVGMECMELFACEHENGHEQCKELCMVHKALQLERPLSYLEIDLPINGSSRSVGLSITPVAVANTIDKPLCLIVARDVTAIRDVNRMKANFLSMITHELRSPLNAINGYLDLALEGIAGDLNEQQREFVRRARASSEHLYALVEDLLLVSRADSGQVRLNREVTGLRDIVDNAVQELELMASDNGVSVGVDMATDFPRVYVDPVRLQQVLRNLISNSLRFTSSGGSVTVTASIFREEQAVTAASSEGDGEARESGEKGDGEDEDIRLLKLEVRDTGVGIAVEHQQRIFERFFQVSSAGGRISGQGLGLAIVKMIVELHGGMVFVASEPGKGSLFTCYIPCLLS
ncbi:MAG TPA: GAF domain-containing protein [Ktedonobacteraceae bacterium]|nr:GAF domain-containing protein [Ktedonobacteraceae bacterium]